ncbi:hypothetical protein FQA39_LY05916 [Lamprigera yunnana]|nr:hypothetical protein FQA39_LY05916 [Lamprigera yunnana]
MSRSTSPQIEADKRLLQFKVYEDYLDSLVTSMDLCNLQSVVVARKIAELGYRSSGDTLSRKSFEKRFAAVIAYLYPSYKPYELDSEGEKLRDPLQQALAIRERPNRLGVITCAKRVDSLRGLFIFAKQTKATQIPVINICIKKYKILCIR